MRQIKAVIFDLDDTLIDWSKQESLLAGSGRWHVDQLHAHLTKQGHTLPTTDEFYTTYRQHIVNAWAEAKKVWGGVNFANCITQILQSFDIVIPENEQKELLRAYAWHPVKGVEPYEDTFEVLDYLKNNHYKIGLVTNSMFPMWMRDIELEHYGLMTYLDARITSGDTGYMKPHPAIYWRMLGLLDLMPHEAIFVGDRPTNDIVGANEVGLVSVWINPPHLNYDLEGIIPNHEITQLREILPILQKLA